MSTTNNNKVEYLSKYFKSEHKRSKNYDSKNNEQPNSRTNQLIIDDDDDTSTVNLNFKNGKKDDLDESEDEKPTVANVEGLDAKINYNLAAHLPRGTWDDQKTVVINDQSTSIRQQPQLRQRHDSESSVYNSKETDDQSVLKLLDKKLTHHDSKDIIGITCKTGEKIRRHRHDSDSSNEKGRRRRHDSDSSESNENEKGRRRRHDSESCESDNEADRNGVALQKSHMPKLHSHDEKSSGHHRRNSHEYSDDSDDGNVRKNRSMDHSSGNSQQQHQVDYYNGHGDDGKHIDNKQARMSSGHKSGMQSGTEFSRREVKLQRKKIKEVEQFLVSHGASGETVYRDRDSGRKLDKLTEHQDQHQNRKKISKALSPNEQRVLNSGRVQLEREEQLKRDFEKIQESSFARHRNDSELEKILKAKIHADDPMASYAVKMQKTGATKDIIKNELSQKQRPTYKGPPPTPNRFNIHPGYRWDAHDRGNGFESKLLAKKYNAEYQGEKAYRYSSADM